MRSEPGSDGASSLVVQTGRSLVRDSETIMTTFAGLAEDALPLRKLGPVSIGRRDLDQLSSGGHEFLVRLSEAGEVSPDGGLGARLLVRLRSAALRKVV